VRTPTNTKTWTEYKVLKMEQAAGEALEKHAVKAFCASLIII